MGSPVGGGFFAPRDDGLVARHAEPTRSGESKHPRNRNVIACFDSRQVARLSMTGFGELWGGTDRL